MSTSRYLFVLLVILVRCGSSSGDLGDSRTVRLVIGLNEDSASFRVQNKVHGTFENSIKRAHAVSMTVPRNRLELLMNDTAVDYFYEDRLVYPMVEEREDVGWGIPFIDADNTFIPLAAPKQMNNENCFKVCIVDGGLQSSHPDLPFSGPGDQHVKGKTFNLPVGETWHDPVYHHGTHVAVRSWESPQYTSDLTCLQGILIATANNGIGIQGVVGDASNMCLLVARVFSDDGSGQNDSVVLEAVEWCADNGANIINLSLGSPHSGTPAAKAVYDRIIKEDGALVISASGNSYSTEYNYPASWPDVLSVGAVDRSGKRASFSNHNDRLNIAAPGVEIQSTAPVSAIIDTTTGNAYEMRIMKHSVLPEMFFTGKFYECGDGVVASDFAGAEGKICVAQRGSVTFREKAEFCEANGGVALVVVNNEAGKLSGTLGEEKGVFIPVVGVTQVDGAIIRTLDSASLTARAPGYLTRSGTSMAAKIWAARPECSADQVREAILRSADKSSLVADPDEFLNSFGEGLVQAEGAYLALMQNPPPCGGPIDFEPGLSDEESGIPGVEIPDEVESPSDPPLTDPPTPIYLDWDSAGWYDIDFNNTIEVWPESKETPKSSDGQFFQSPETFGSPTIDFIDLGSTVQTTPILSESDESPQDSNSILEENEEIGNSFPETSSINHQNIETTRDPPLSDPVLPDFAPSTKDEQIEEEEGEQIQTDTTGTSNIWSNWTPQPSASGSNGSSVTTESIWGSPWRWVPSGGSDRRFLRKGVPVDGLKPLLLDRLRLVTR